MEQKWVTLAIWLATAACQAAIVAAIFLKRLQREVPLFLSYTLLGLLSFPLLFWLSKVSYQGYFYVYWGREAVSLVLGLFVVYEVFAAVFLKYDELRRLGALLFRWAALVCVLLAVTAAIAAPGNESDKIMAGVLLLSRTVRIVQVGLLCLMFLLSGYLRMAWPHYALGIGAGLALYVVVDLAALSLRSSQGGAVNDVLFTLKPASYLIALLLWTAYFALPAPAPETATAPRKQLEEWNQTLREMLS